MKNMACYIPPEPMDMTSDAITRVSMINKTNVEYGDCAANLALGCSHGCLYCYAYNMSRRWGKVSSYEEWCRPKIVSNALELIAKEIPKLRFGTVVHFSFMTDPFMYGHPEMANLTLQAIAMLNNAGFKCTTLTKGILPAELANLNKYNEHGITLCSLNEAYRMRYEPGSAPFEERLVSLERLHNLGCKTWVSIEPYPTPNLAEPNLDEILNAVSFADKIIFGRMNYSKEVSSYVGHKEFYNEKAQQVIDFCRSHGIAFHIKKKTIS